MNPAIATSLSSGTLTLAVAPQKFQTKTHHRDSVFQTLLFFCVCANNICSNQIAAINLCSTIRSKSGKFPRPHNKCEQIDTNRVFPHLTWGNWRRKKKHQTWFGYLWFQPAMSSSSSGIHGKQMLPKVRPWILPHEKTWSSSSEKSTCART